MYLTVHFLPLRYRLGADKFDQMSSSLITIAFGLPDDQSEDTDRTDPQDKYQSKNTSPSVAEAQQPATAEIGKKETESIVEIPKAKGKLKLDATVADQMIKYPTDLDLLNDSRELSKVSASSMHYVKN